MPRTKMNRKPTNKRVRRDSADLEEFLRDFDIEVENSITLLQSQSRHAIKQIDTNIQDLKKLYSNILNVKLGDLIKGEPMETDEAVIQKTMSNLDVTVKQTVSKGDEGYSTEEHSINSKTSMDDNNYGNISILGPLPKIQTKRRSKSAIGMKECVNLQTSNTPGPRALMSASKLRTPLFLTQTSSSTHMSRSKQRTPIVGRPKAASVDRYQMITPKANPNNPFSILRHARIGEAVFSITGSPIVPTNVCELTANVNIPYADGVISIRPTYIDPTNIDPSFMQKIDESTINHLRTLKANLDLIMAKADGKFFKK
ncbi:unnamed protein product [Diamesa serratosioi]